MSLADPQWCPSSVQVTVQQARGLRAKGKSGTNDAYALMQVGKEKFQTSVVEKSVAPVWREEAAFDLPPPLHQDGGGGGGKERGTLHVHVLHRALVGPDKLLGQAVINLLQLGEDKTRDKAEWFKLLDKTGKADKDRGEVLLDIQFMRNNMTGSMFDLSATGKSRSRLGKLKDKVRGKKKESDTTSNVVPSFNQVLTESDEEGDGEVVAGKGDKKKKHKVKSLFSHKSNLQKNMSQSMSVLTAKNFSLSGSQSSGLNVDPSEGKKKFKFLIHKRSNSSDNKDASSGHEKHGAAEQSNVCINGSHVYCEEPPPRASRIGSNFSLASSGHGSMEDVPENSPSVDSLRVVRQYSPWTEEEEEELENKKEDVGQLRREEEEKIRMEEEMRRKEEERVRREEELERLADEKRRQEEEERRTEEENVKREEEANIRREEERRRQEEEERVKREQEECKRLADKKWRLQEQERLIEEERVRKEEEERVRKEEEERVHEERVRKEEEILRMQEEEREKKRFEEQERSREEERIRMEEESAQEERRQEEEERVRRQEEELDKKRFEEQERSRKEEEERIRMEESAQEERRQEERVRRQEEEREEKRFEEQERSRKEEEERIRMEEESAQEERRQEEEERVRRQEEELEKKRFEEQERSRKEEEERIRMEEESAQEERRQEERVRRQEEEREKKRFEEQERSRKEEEERIRMEEESAQGERRRQEEEEREEKRRFEKQERSRKEEEERIRMAEESAQEERRQEEERKLAEEKRRLEEEERRRREHEERIKKEEKARREKEEYERLMEEKRKLEEEEERKRIKAEEKIRREEEKRIRVEEERMQEEERVRKQEEEREQLAEEKRIQERRIAKERKQREEEERVRKEKEINERLVVEKLRQQEQKRRIAEEEKIRRERKEEEVRKLETEKLTREAGQQKRDNKTKPKAAGAKPTVAVESSAEVTSTNPFDENFSNNPFEEIPDSPAGPDSATATMSTVQQRVQFAALSGGSKPVSSDEKDSINTQRERRPAPQPPGRNQAERPSRREQDGATQPLAQINKKSKDKDIKTVSVLPQRSVQMIAPLSRSPTEKKNTQSLTQSCATKETSNVVKHSKRTAPLRPGSVEEGLSSEQKTALSSDDVSHECGSEVKQVSIVHGLNPFEDDAVENAAQDDSTTSGGHFTEPVLPVVSQAADKDAATQTKIKSSKAHAPPLPAKTDATSSTSINQNTERGRVADGTGVTVNSATHACDPASEALSPVRVQETPLQESQPAPVQSAGEDAGGIKVGPPKASRRLQPVKPLHPLEQQSVSVDQGVKDNKSTGILGEVQVKTKVKDTGLKGPYSQLTQGELISLVRKQEKQLSERDKKISELEQYIDNLLVRIIEEKPSILMSLNSLNKAT